MDDKNRILDLVAQRNAAVARGDAAAIVAPLSEDIVAYTLAPPLAYSGAEARNTKSVEAWLATWKAPPRIELRDPTVLLDGNLAVVFGFAAMRGAKIEGDEEGLWYRITTVLRRENGEWSIVHEHESVPFLMDGSDKAALDLKP
jgi:ketosteroid isomerase-like protein